MPEEIADPERLVREVTFAVEGDGRTIEARIVPYDVDTQVVDSPANGGTGVPYMERWKPGVFEKQARALDKIKVFLNFEHGRGIGEVVGHAVALREEPDALYGTFRVHPTPDGDKALHLVNEGVLTGLSLEAIPKVNAQRNGVVERVKATLENVALVRRAAFPDAMVLAVREKLDEEQAEAIQEAWTEATAPLRVELGEAPWEFLKREEVKPDPEPQHSAEVDEALQRYGFEPLLKRAVSTRAWSGSTGRFTDEQYERSSLICRTGDAPPKERCSLPVLEPNGDVNTNALGAAAARLNQVTGVTGAQRAAAARKLVRYYRQAGMEAPESVRNLARR